MYDFDEFLSEAFPASIDTQRQYRLQLKKAQKSVDILSDDVEEIEGYLQELNDSAFRQTRAAINGFREFNGLEPICAPRRYTRLRDLGVTRVREYVDKGDAPLPCAIVVGLILAGFTVSDICKVKMEDIDFSTQIVRAGNKTAKADVKTLACIRAFACLRMNDSGEFLFATKRRTPVNPKYIRGLVQSIGEKCEVESLRITDLRASALKRKESEN